MNIFVLDQRIVTCARYHCDQHVIKMILESAQILCTALHLHGIEAPYRPTHQRHPCVLWTAESWTNALWLRDLMIALNQEYRYRWDREQDHASMKILPSFASPQYVDTGLTDFAQAMPEVYRVPGDPVRAYRQFYRAEKRHFARWSKRPVPEWFLQEAL